MMVDMRYRLPLRHALYHAPFPSTLQRAVEHRERASTSRRQGNHFLPLLFSDIHLRYFTFSSLLDQAVAAAAVDIITSAIWHCYFSAADINDDAFCAVKRCRAAS